MAKEFEPIEPTQEQINNATSSFVAKHGRRPRGAAEAAYVYRLARIAAMRAELEHHGLMPPWPPELSENRASTLK
jgi:hypothetical protein